MVKMPSLFGKKKGGKGAPTERVKTLSTQGLSEPEIIANLRKEGYSPGDVDKAMRTALKEAVSPAPYEKPAVPARTPYREPPRRAPPREDLELPDLGPPPAPRGMEEMLPEERELPPPKRPELPPLEELPPMGPPPAQAPMEDEWEGPEEEWRPPGAEPARPAWRPPGRGMEPLPSLERPTPTARRSEIEEIAESIIDEKWQDFERRISDIGKKVEGLGNRVAALETTIAQSRGGAAPAEVQAIKESLDTYKGGMSELGSRMEAMESAIKDSLTPMMQSMRSLSEAVKEIKGVKKP